MKDFISVYIQYIYIYTYIHTYIYIYIHTDVSASKCALNMYIDAYTDDGRFVATPFSHFQTFYTEHIFWGHVSFFNEYYIFGI